MLVNGKHYYTIWLKDSDNQVVQIIDQRHLPHKFVIEDLTNLDEASRAIKDMHVRGAPLIGATAAYGMYLAALDGIDLEKAAQILKNTRPTAVDLKFTVEKQLKECKGSEDLVKTTLKTALQIAKDSVKQCSDIGIHGVELIKAISKKKDVVNILTHCNAGWLATVDHGTATSPIYAAHALGLKIHVWVDETRPRNQGARLTAWELHEHGIPHTVIADNAGGHLMQNNMVDLVIVGTDRTTYTGDVANKIGTYLKALAAKDNDIPFYVAAPSSSIDWNLEEGKNIPIEQRNENEVKHIFGKDDSGEIKRILLTPKNSPAANYAFDVTPKRLVTGLITERGICEAGKESILKLFPENG